MNKYNRVHPLMSEAFVIWLTYLGYKCVISAGGAQFYNTATGKGFPRNVMIMAVSYTHLTLPTTPYV